MYQEYYFRKSLAMKVRAPSRVVSEVWAKYNDLPTKILRRHATTNSSEQKLKTCL